MELAMSHGNRPELEPHVEHRDRHPESACFSTTTSPSPNIGVYGVGSGYRSDEDDWTAKEFWDAYKNHPERLKRKQEEKLVRQQEREAAKRRRKEEKAAEKVAALEERAKKIQQQLHEAQKELEAAQQATSQDHSLLQQPASNDWLLHEGNVSYCRDRSMFDSYTPISATACAADGGKMLPVLGIGSTTIHVRRQFGQPQARPFTIAGLLHIPSARCNGLSIPRNEVMGYTIKQREGSDRVTVSDSRNNAAVFCANRSSGRIRLCMKGEGDGEDASTHITRDTPISISADRAALARLAPGWMRAE